MKKNKKKNHTLHYIKLLFLSTLSVFFLTVFFKETFLTFSLKNQINAESSLSESYDKEIPQYQQLKEQLSDAKYAEIYAKGQLLITEENEQVFKISEDE